MKLIKKLSKVSNLVRIKDENFIYFDIEKSTLNQINLKNLKEEILNKYQYKINSKLFVSDKYVVYTSEISQGEFKIILIDKSSYEIEEIFNGAVSKHEDDFIFFSTSINQDTANGPSRNYFHNFISLSNKNIAWTYNMSNTQIFHTTSEFTYLVTDEILSCIHNQDNTVKWSKHLKEIDSIADKRSLKYLTWELEKTNIWIPSKVSKYTILDNKNGEFLNFVEDTGKYASKNDYYTKDCRLNRLFKIGYQGVSIIDQQLQNIGFEEVNYGDRSSKPSSKMIAQNNISYYYYSLDDSIIEFNKNSKLITDHYETSDFMTHINVSDEFLFANTMNGEILIFNLNNY